MSERGWTKSAFEMVIALLQRGRAKSVRHGSRERVEMSEFPGVLKITNTSRAGIKYHRYQVVGTPLVSR